MRVLFLYLNAFSAVGGIQKFNKNLVRALEELVFDTVCYSLHDLKTDFPKTTTRTKFFSATGNKVKFIINSLKYSTTTDTILIAHINLTFPLALLIKVFLPKKKIILITHGIEIWQNLSWSKKIGLKACNEIVTVSNYTRQQIINKHKITPSRIKILHNTIDEDFKPYEKDGKPIDLLQKYHLTGVEKIILTVCRLNSTEKNKGYDKVIEMLPRIIKTNPSVKYILVGKGDINEINRIKSLITSLGLDDYVILTGYVSEDDLPKYYALCDVFIMPSEKEGFGIVFLEALVSGKLVIGGNRDGSVDALLNGRLGTLINPRSADEIYSSLLSKITMNDEEIKKISPEIKRITQENFGFSNFKKNILEILCRK